MSDLTNVWPNCRQGDPGSTRYFLSLEDNLFRIFGGDRIKGLMNAFGVADLPIESKMLTNSLNESQRKVCTPHVLCKLAMRTHNNNRN